MPEPFSDPAGTRDPLVALIDLVFLPKMHKIWSLIACHKFDLAHVFEVTMITEKFSNLKLLIVAQTVIFGFEDFAP